MLIHLRLAVIEVQSDESAETSQTILFQHTHIFLDRCLFFGISDADALVGKPANRSIPTCLITLS